MKRDDIIRMAREAGMLVPQYRDHIEHLERFVASAEREAWPNLECVASWIEGGCDPQEAAKELRLYIAAIRARGQA